MLIWNIFTVLFGCLLAAISPDTWEQLIGKSKKMQTISITFIAISICAFTTFWTMVCSEAFYTTANIIKPVGSGGCIILCGPSREVMFLLKLLVLTAILSAIYFLNILGRRLINPQWQTTFSKGTLIGAIIFGVAAPIYDLDRNWLPLVLFALGTCMWLLFIIGLTNNGPITADKNYYTKKVKVAKAIIGATALLFLARHISNEHQAISDSIERLFIMEPRATAVDPIQ